MKNKLYEKVNNFLNEGEYLESKMKESTNPDILELHKNPIIGIKKVIKTKIFKPSGTFKAILNALKFLVNAGYSYGLMHGNDPIAIAKGRNIFIPKWYDLKPADIKKIDGVIIPMPEFKNGGAKIVFYK
ncbi:MAG: hypothetical protein QXG00_06625 [Candidatus Woesearchaeota archaeon]